MDQDLILKNPFSNVFIEIINLKYSQLNLMINELNSIAEYFLDENGYHLYFKICESTDKTFLWKLTIRFECIKVLQII